MKVSVYIACSVDGFIARQNGDLDWLPQEPTEDGEDYGYQEFISSIDCMLMGFNTYKKLLEFDEWPYDIPVVVMTSTKMAEIPGRARFTSATPLEVYRDLESRGLKRIYLDGGLLIQSFLQENLVDDLIITTIPVLIGQGRPLFGNLKQDKKLAHLKTQSFSSGMVQTHYRIQR